jgi:hypothetical protein
VFLSRHKAPFSTHLSVYYNLTGGVVIWGQVKRLANKWWELLHEVSGGDRGIEKALGKLFQKEQGFRDRFGFDPKLTEYVEKMMGFYRDSGDGI